MTNGQVVMHYSRHCLAASMTTWLWPLSSDQ